MAGKGRPKIDDRRMGHHVRLNSEEYSMLQFISEGTGMTKSQVIRDLIKREFHRACTMDSPE